ncbi:MULTISPECIES: helix-turn-helix domain-containing protein [Streptomycetaceae]|uniref:Putative transcriptional regulator, PucR family n=1 Tax=Streptantibioticus cattleyicolor (strain ATCC 35852 / DSM 46488 / JCM 4925 / NBRC 14057 / NRRL 8057) TaxID=1003195 RepID=G8WYK6_STREN|nr:MULTISPECIES: helix-turn-helix domain-containing protein [Streptomycetaceae]AEW98137.1 putative transcriptional regulator, PucR family [Streptantibioticus cattleyicolor NRRL 8057 = DSM 46488]MYS62526.1 GAF domain-containing protein [Streptomyces sp. SID5468]
MPEQTASAAPFLRRLLDLLADDAPAEAFGAVAARARAAGVGPGDLAEVEAATATALRVRGVMRQHRRRELQLSALFDTAGDLAASRDLDAVLNAIVRRARKLLGTDTAYLTLPDEAAGDTHMRVTDGSVSPLFQSLRLRLGEGLGGLVAQTARPYATPDYRTDERFVHTPAIDAGVLDEGLVAILGVPLLLGSSRPGGGTVAGVLFAAERSPRAFAPDETALLCSLAAHAAIAIDTARALADTRTALADLAAANAAVQAHSAALQRAEEAHDRLTDLVLRGGDVPEVATAVAGLLDGPITVHDPAGRVTAAVRPGGAAFAADGLDPREITTATEDSRAAARAVRRDGRWVCAVLAGPELLAALVLHGRGGLGDSDRRLFERAAVVTGLLLLLRRTVAETENRIRGELVTDLLTDPGRDPAGLAERGRRLGVDLDRPHLLLVAEAPAGAREKLGGAAVRYLFGADADGVSAEHAGGVVLLIADDGGRLPPGDTARATAAQLGQLTGAPVTVAAAGPAAGPRDLAAAHAEAVRCLRAMRVLGRTGDGACPAELGFLGVVLGNGHDVADFVTATLGPLLGYDARRGTELVRTLDAYFSCGASLTRAKDELHVHVNTVVQRLERVQALLGPDWNTPDRALELQLALRLRRLGDHK